MKIYILILLTTWLVGCGVDEGDVIGGVEYMQNSDKWEYTTKDGNYFYARPHLYNVGDTVWFTKK